MIRSAQFWATLTILDFEHRRSLDHRHHQQIRKLLGWHLSRLIERLLQQVEQQIESRGARHGHVPVEKPVPLSIMHGPANAATQALRSITHRSTHLPCRLPA
jgi:hypothetical protein